jgi:predicted nucleic acid-binding Zn ribbon protein
MPTYEFECPQCGKIEETFLKHVITDEEIKAKLCCNQQMNQNLFSFNWKINDKDHGWYVQDRGWNNESPEYNFHKKKKLESIIT